MPFKLSTRGHYAVMIMYNLALSASSFTPLSVIAANQNLSQGYLEQIIRPLKDAELVISRKGFQGGYKLAKPPGEITVGVIIRTVEGPVIPVKCVDEDSDYCSCIDDCRARQVWQKVTDAIDKVLDSVTLEDLVKGELFDGK